MPHWQPSAEPRRKAHNGRIELSFLPFSGMVTAASSRRFSGGKPAVCLSARETEIDFFCTQRAQERPLHLVGRIQSRAPAPRNALEKGTSLVTPCATLLVRIGQTGGLKGQAMGARNTTALGARRFQI